MKRWPLFASFVLFIALCASLAYWAMQFFKPPVRPVAAPPPSAQAPVNIDAAAGLFGGKGSAAVASNFQLKGVIMAGNPADSVAILAADGKPAQAVRANAELQPGIKVKEVNRRYVVLLDNGVEKRVELPEDNASAGVEASSASPVAKASLAPRPAPAMPATVVNNSAPDTPDSAADTANSAGSTPPASAGSPSANAATPAPPSGSAAAPQPRTPPPTPGAGMGSPPIMNQGSPAGMPQASSGTPNPVMPGMPVPAPPPPRP